LENPVEVPNVFTPNSDGTNDFFLPTSQVPITIVEFQVWNRWGQLVYENENPLSGWDGTQDGEPALSDVYVYRIVWEITGGSGARTEEKGDVTLIR
jgi:gliding motility-associated-like protein